MQFVVVVVVINPNAAAAARRAALFFAEPMSVCQITKKKYKSNCHRCKTDYFPVGVCVGVERTKAPPCKERHRHAFDPGSQSLSRNDE